MQRVGPYLLEDELGRGAMGVVYRARTAAGGVVALKRVLDLSDPDALERFRREAFSARRLAHPNLIRVLDFGVEGGCPYLVMPLLEGPTLKERLRAGPLPIALALGYAAALAEGLAHAHSQQVLHRDLKPENVILTAGGPVLTDFGLAKLTLDRQSLTQTGQLLGTPAYMAPEQAMGARSQLGPATDVYGLGATLYALLCGSPPFEGPTMLSVLSQVGEKAAPPPSRRRPELSPEVDALVLRCLAKDPGERFPDMQSLATALHTARDLSAADEVAPRGGSRKGLWAFAVTGLVSAALLAAFALLPAARDEPTQASATPTRAPQASPTLTPGEEDRFGIPAGVHPVDYVYDAVFLGLEEPEAVAARWREGGAERVRDPDLRVAWGLVRGFVEHDFATAAEICSSVEAEVGTGPRLRVVRAIVTYGRTDPEQAGRDLRADLDSPQAPRYLRGLYAFWLVTRDRDQEAQLEAERSAREGDPGGAQVLSLLAKRRGDAAGELRGWDEVERLCRAALPAGAIPSAWLIERSGALSRAGDLTRAEACLAEAAAQAPWSGEVRRVWAQTLLARAAREPHQELTGRAIEQLLASLPGLRTPRAISDVAQDLILLGRAPLPAWRALASLRLVAPSERRQRADLLFDVAWSLESAQLVTVLEDFEVLISDQGSPGPQAERLAQRALLRVELGRRAEEEPALELHAGALKDIQRALSLKGGSPLVWESFAWVHLTRGAAGLSEAADCAHKSLRLGEQPYLRGLWGELALWKGDTAELAQARVQLTAPEKIARGQAGGFGAADYRYSESFLGALVDLSEGRVGAASLSFGSLLRRESGVGDWQREEEARVYYALCLAQAGEWKRALASLRELRARWPPAQARGAWVLARALIQQAQGGELQPGLVIRLRELRGEWPPESWLARSLERLLAK